jgi:hypothetical protein
VKRFLALLTLVAGSALANSTAVVTPALWDLFKGSTRVSRAHPSEAMCVEAAKARDITAEYTCRTSTAVAVTYVVPPVNPKALVTRVNP